MKEQELVALGLAGKKCKLRTGREEHGHWGSKEQILIIQKVDTRDQTNTESKLIRKAKKLAINSHDSAAGLPLVS